MSSRGDNEAHCTERRNRSFPRSLPLLGYLCVPVLRNAYQRLKLAGQHCKIALIAYARKLPIDLYTWLKEGTMYAGHNNFAATRQPPAPSSV